LSASVIETLASLQEIDRRNRERQNEIADIEREAAALTAATQEKRRQVEASRLDSGQVGGRRRELETQLQAEEQKIKDRRMRLGRIRNDKELSAAQREIEVSKESNARLEEELIALLEQNEALDGNLREVEAELAALEEQLAQQSERMDGRIVKLRAEIDSEMAQRDQVASALGGSIRKKYEQIFAKRGGMAVVEVRDGHCRGCNMNVPPQLFIEIRKGLEVILCPSCHRILFFRPDPAQVDGAEDA
jgi:hypothetical protein